MDPKGLAEENGGINSQAPLPCSKEGESKLSLSLSHCSHFDLEGLVEANGGINGQTTLQSRKEWSVDCEAELSSSVRDRLKLFNSFLFNLDGLAKENGGIKYQTPLQSSKEAQTREFFEPKISFSLNDRLKPLNSSHSDPDSLAEKNGGINQQTPLASAKEGSVDFEPQLSLSHRPKPLNSSHSDRDGVEKEYGGINGQLPLPFGKEGSADFSSLIDHVANVTNKPADPSEKDIRHLSSCLVDLKKESAEEILKSVYANYPAFIRTSKEISVLEGQLFSLRNLLSSLAAVIQGLAEGAHVDSLFSGPEGSEEEVVLSFEDREPSKMEKWLAEFEESVDILLAERRVNEALSALDEGECIAKDADHQKKLTPSTLLLLQTTITEQRQKLIDQLAEAACQPFAHGVELCTSIQALKQLADGQRAHTLLLKSHHMKLKASMEGLHPSGASHGGAYTVALSRLVFSTIAQAASDSLAVFGDEPAYASELVTWAVKQTEAFALLMKRHVIASLATSGDLRFVAESVQIRLGYCSLLGARGLALTPVLSKQFRPMVEDALSANLKRIEQNIAALAAADDWSLSYAPVNVRPLGTSLSRAISSQPKLSSSAHKFKSLAQELCEYVSHIESLQFADSALEGLLQVFNSYINMMIYALPGSMETENLEGSGSRIVRMAETEAQQIGLLANALLLADELLPRAAIKLSCLQQKTRINDTPPRASDGHNHLPEQRELKKRLQHLVDQLRDSFCRQHAIEFIFTEDGSIQLSAEMYTSMDKTTNETEWFPSPIYQELFEKLTRMVSIASDIFAGRERFAITLLMRLTETVILWLSDDQSFWEEIEAGSKPLGIPGLQQFYLDMEFVILFSSQGRYLSLNMHQVIKDIISRAIEAVAATGLHPYRSLPEEDWFAEVAQMAIEMLTGKANIGKDEQDLTSLTASVSA